MPRVIIALLALPFLLLSCGPQPHASIAPLTNEKGERVLFSPRNFKVGPNTRGSDLQRLREDTDGKLAPDLLADRMFGDQVPNSKYKSSILFLPFRGTNLRTKKKENLIAPFAVILSEGIPLPAIDNAMDLYRRVLFRELKKQGRVVPASRYKADEPVKTPTSV